MAWNDTLRAAFRDSSAMAYLNRANVWLSPYYRQARARYYKLEKRERILLQAAALAVAVFLAYNLIYSPIVSFQSGMADEIATREHDLTEVRRMAAAYAQVRHELVGLEKNTSLAAADFSLPATLSTALGGVVETDKIAGINPLPNKPVSEQFVQYGADLKLNGVSLAQLVDVLYRIKSIKEPVVVSNMTIRKRAADPHTFEVDMTCSVLGKNA